MHATVDWALHPANSFREGFMSAEGAPPAGQNWQDIFFSSHDGLRLYARRYGEPDAGHRPCLCLPGLTRNSRDFHSLAAALSSDPRRPRTVYSLDYRGRGQSDHDPDWQHYKVATEMQDVLDFMTQEGLSGAALIGTSRGGILTMLMAASHPEVIGPAVLNDIGPVIEADGLARIMAYAGKILVPADWEEAAALARDLNARDFTGISDAEWADIARQWFNDDGGRPAAAYDPQVVRSLEEADTSNGAPDMWPLFDALAHVPVMVIRGGNSDLLSAATVAEMEKQHPGLVSLTVPEQGHAPLLRDQVSQRAIADFLRDTDE
jgi:pimeloyl-ACP methyl ester carboxylesterase